MLENLDVSETKMSIGQVLFYLCTVLNIEKYKRANQFQRHGLGRRQDHGTRGNSSNGYWDPLYSDDALRLSRRKDFRRGGVIELE